MKCKNCSQEIYETTPSIGFNNQIIYMRGRFRHIEGDDLYCKEILPGTPLAQCHICHTTTAEHGIFCSASGIPRHRAET